MEPSHSFLKSGVDFANSFTLKISSYRNALLTKWYACFVKKAVHIKLVNGLSAQDFLHTLNGFFDKREKCKVIYAVNVTNLENLENQ